MLDLLKAAILIPIGIFITLLTWLIVCLIFIAVALCVSAPFILIIGLVLWIFF